MSYNKRNLTVLALLSAEDCVSWLQGEGLIPSDPRCVVCNASMKTRVRGNRQVLFRCHRQVAAIVHEIRKNGLDKTFFSNSKTSLITIVIIIYYFSRNQTSLELLVRECSDRDRLVPSSVVAQWLSHCREACLIWMYKECDRDQVLGGEDVLVEVDLCRVDKCKYPTETLSEGAWVLALIEVSKSQQPGRYRLEVCGADATEPEVLMEMVARLTHPRTRIDTGLWSAHWGLSRGQHHYMVDKEQMTVTPIHKSNAYAVGALWQAKRPAVKQNMALYLGEYLYRRELKLTKQEAFAHFLKILRAPFPEV